MEGREIGAGLPDLACEMLAVVVRQPDMDVMNGVGIAGTAGGNRHVNSIIPTRIDGEHSTVILLAVSPGRRTQLDRCLIANAAPVDRTVALPPGRVGPVRIMAIDTVDHQRVDLLKEQVTRARIRELPQQRRRARSLV